MGGTTDLRSLLCDLVPTPEGLWAFSSEAIFGTGGVVKLSTFSTGGLHPHWFSALFDLKFHLKAVLGQR